MTQKIGKIMLGIVAGAIIVAVIGYVISGLLSDDAAQSEVIMIKDNLLANETINSVQERSSTMDFPVTVSNNETGVTNPF
jgi:hypothetical protein